MLGAGGPEIDDGRSSSSYVIWHQERAKVLLDVGSGSSVQFDLAKADFADLEAIFLSHLHTDHSADLPAYVKGSFFTTRDTDLPVYGPGGNNIMPSTTEFVQRLFGERGAFAYLSDYLHKGKESYQIQAFDIPPEARQSMDKIAFPWGSATALPVHHGPNPALAWRIELAGCTIAYSGDMSNQTGALSAFIQGVDLFIAHMAIPDKAGSIAKNLHMPPKAIGKILLNAKPKRVLLSHFMKRSEAGLADHIRVVKQSYHGDIVVASEQLTVGVQSTE